MSLHGAEESDVHLRGLNRTRCLAKCAVWVPASCILPLASIRLQSCVLKGTSLMQEALARGQQTQLWNSCMTSSTLFLTASCFGLSEAFSESQDGERRRVFCSRLKEVSLRIKKNNSGKWPAVTLWLLYYLLLLSLMCAFQYSPC